MKFVSDFFVIFVWNFELGFRSIFFPLTTLSVCAVSRTVTGWLLHATQRTCPAHDHEAVNRECIMYLRTSRYIDATSNLEIPLSMQDQKVNNETANQEQSLTLVLNLIRVKISQIAYMRNIFPSYCFEECKRL